MRVFFVEKRTIYNNTNNKICAWFPPEGKHPTDELGKFPSGSIIYFLNPFSISDIIAFSIGAVRLLFLKIVAAFVTSWGVIEFGKDDVIVGTTGLNGSGIKLSACLHIWLILGFFYY